MPTEVRKINFSEDCKKISVSFATASPTTVVITDMNDVEVTLTSSDFTYSGGILSFEYTHTSALVGVLQVLPKNAGGTTLTPAYSVATCKINCCIGTLLHDVLNYTCKCDKCKEEMVRLEKIYLLLQASIYEAENTANLTQAVNNYNKASEFCLEVCACGC